MPIHYASILNQRNVVVLQGVYAKTQTIFKTHVIQYANVITKFATKQVQIDERLSIVYKN